MAGVLPPCLDCGAPLKGAGKTGRCRSCAAKASHADPAFRARLEAGLRRVKASPEHRAVMKAASRRTHDDRASDPAWQAYKRASGHRLRRDYIADPDAQRRNAATRAAVGQKISDTRLAWCPPSYRAEYRRLRKAMLAIDARRVIEEQIAKDERARVAALTPLERQLERLRAGATLIERPRLPGRQHDFTLGGVASGQL